MRATPSFIIALALVSCDRSDPLASSPESVMRAASAADAAALTASATGAGNTVVAGELRTFSFTAQLKEDGTASGTAQVNNRMVNEMFQLDLDCLQVAGNIAIMSGIITRHTDTTAIGLTGIFGVIDNGAGANDPPDEVTQVFFFRPGLVSCRDIDPALVPANATPIAGGNVQVH
jgi:hypothetical protein